MLSTVGHCDQSRGAVAMLSTPAVRIPLRSSERVSCATRHSLPDFVICQNLRPAPLRLKNHLDRLAHRAIPAVSRPSSRSYFYKRLICLVRSFRRKRLYWNTAGATLFLSESRPRGEGYDAHGTLPQPTAAFCLARRQSGNSPIL